MMSVSASTSSTAKMKKDESFLGKLGGTLARKKKSKEGKSFGKFLLFKSSKPPAVVPLVLLSMVLQSHDMLKHWPLGHQHWQLDYTQIFIDLTFHCCSSPSRVGLKSHKQHKRKQQERQSLTAAPHSFIMRRHI